MELQCVEGIQDWQADCVERCEGTIMDVERLSDSVKNEAGLEPLIAAYEGYKYPESSNLTYPDTMKSQSRVHVCRSNSCISRPHIQKQPEVHSDLRINLNLRQHQKGKKGRIKYGNFLTTFCRTEQPSLWTSCLL